MTTAPSYSLECAYETGNGWASAPMNGGYRYTVRALAEKLAARLGALQGDVIVIAHNEPVTPEVAALAADHVAHVAAYIDANGLDDIPF